MLKKEQPPQVDREFLESEVYSFGDKLSYLVREHTPELAAYMMCRFQGMEGIRQDVIDRYQQRLNAANQEYQELLEQDGRDIIEIINAQEDDPTRTRVMELNADAFVARGMVRDLQEGITPYTSLLAMSKEDQGEKKE